MNALNEAAYRCYRVVGDDLVPTAVRAVAVTVDPRRAVRDGDLVVYETRCHALLGVVALLLTEV